jgi:hypothetical protein
LGVLASPPIPIANRLVPHWDLFRATWHSLKLKLRRHGKGRKDEKVVQSQSTHHTYKFPACHKE